MLTSRKKLKLSQVLILVAALNVFLLLYFFFPSSFFSSARLQFSGYVYTIANIPSKAITNTIGYFRSKNQILDENKLLKIENSLLNERLGRYKAMQLENIEMKRLLNSIEIKNTSSKLALITNELELYEGHRIILNKGKTENAFIGQAIIDAYGLLGKVIEVSGSFSKVILVSDSKSSVPVVNSRTGFRTLTKGQNDFEFIKLQLISETIDIKVGDEFYTSGIGEYYPKGILVGRVSKIKPISRGGFFDITIKLATKLRNSNIVLMLFYE